MYPFADLPVGLDYTAKILTESVLVENPLIGVCAVDIPKAAGIGADLIGNKQLTGLIQTHFQLEIHQLQPQILKERQQHSVDPADQILHALAQFETHYSKQSNPSVREQRIPKIIILVIEIEKRWIESGALGNWGFTTKRAGRGVTQHHLDRNHIHTLHDHPGVI